MFCDDKLFWSIHGQFISFVLTIALSIVQAARNYSLLHNYLKNCRARWASGFWPYFHSSGKVINIDPTVPELETFWKENWTSFWEIKPYKFSTKFYRRFCVYRIGYLQSIWVHKRYILINHVFDPSFVSVRCVYRICFWKQWSIPDYKVAWMPCS